MTSAQLGEANSGSNSFLALASLDQAALDALPEAVYLCARDGRVLRFNRKAVELWGRTLKAGDPEVRFCGSFRLYRTDGALLPHDQCLMAAALQTGECFHNREVVMEQPNGHRLTVLVNIAAFKDKDGHVNGAINCFKDITDREHAEAVLQDSERRFREMVDALPAAVYTTDAEGRITHFNHAAAAFAGRAPKLGTDEWCVTWKLYHPDGTPMPHDQCPMAIALKEGRVVRGAEAIAERPDGTRVWFTPYPTPMRDDLGRIVGAVNMLVDISERKRAEQTQSALHEFTKGLYRAETLDQAYEAALNAIGRALGCTRSSILLFDERAVMRFVAWRGLSERYRAAVEGHSPWARSDKDPQPVCIADVDAAEFDPSLKEVVKAEKIAALAFIPLVTQRALVGKFMAYFEAPHAFTAAELDVAITIARQLGFAVQRMKAEEARRRAQEDLEAELADTKLLQRVSTRLIQADGFSVILHEILDAAIEVSGAQMGNIQLLESTGVLKIAAQRGFETPFLDFFEDVHDGQAACGAAMQRGERVIVDDVQQSPVFLGTPALQVLLEAGVRAVQSTPLVTREGRLLGMFSTHYRTPRRPSERELRLLDILARQAADLIEGENAEQSLRQLAAILQSTNDAVMGLDLNGMITAWNGAAEKMFGHSAAEAIGKPFAFLIPPDRLEAEKGYLERLGAGGHVDHYETVRMCRDGTLIDVDITVSPILDSGGRLVGASKIVRDISERKRSQARQELLAGEIQHRTKNLFSVVRAVVGRSFAGKQTVEDAESAVTSRLASLAQTHVMLMDKQWEGLDLAEVVSAEMSPYAGRVKIEGPKLMLNPKAAQNFSLAVHELATNAAKYGALSNTTGWVHISWSVKGDNADDTCHFHWQEHGGPCVAAPKHRGFGTTVLEYVMGEYFSEPPQMEFAPSGLSYALTASLSAIAGYAGQGEDLAIHPRSSSGPVHVDFRR
jgi:PAS domain S-box-containing protein